MALTRRELLASGAMSLGAVALPGSAAAASARKALPFEEYARHDAMGLAELVRKGEASPSELLEAAIARTEALNPALNAVVIEHYDRARAAVAKGLPEGPLRGVPFLIKDLFAALEGTVTTQGSRFFADSVEAVSDVVVRRYEASGLVIYGKTASPEFGAAATTETLLFGDTHNPWKRGISSGGSSGGAAAAVASGMVPAAHASDGGGSIRIPASSCGIFGLKPSRGRIPAGADGIDRTSGLATDHVVSRSVRDNALLLDLTAGPVPGTYSPAVPPKRPFLQEVGADPGELRIGLQRDSFLLPKLHPDCEKAVLATAKQCEALGHAVEEVAAPKVDPEAFFGAFSTVFSAPTSNVIQAREAALGRAVTPDDLEPHNFRSHVLALQVTGLSFEKALHELGAIAAQIINDQAPYDVVLSATLGAPPPPHGSLRSTAEKFEATATASAAFTIQYNVSGQPAMSVPLHWNDEGLPIGVMFAAAPGREDVLLRLAAQLEVAHPWAERRPPL